MVWECSISLKKLIVSSSYFINGINVTGFFGEAIRLNSQPFNSIFRNERYRTIDIIFISCIWKTKMTILELFLRSRRV